MVRKSLLRRGPGSNTLRLILFGVSVHGRHSLASNVVNWCDAVLLLAMLPGGLIYLRVFQTLRQWPISWCLLFLLDAWWVKRALSVIEVSFLRDVLQLALSMLWPIRRLRTTILGVILRIIERKLFRFLVHIGFMNLRNLNFIVSQIYIISLFLIDRWFRVEYLVNEIVFVVFLIISSAVLLILSSRSWKIYWLRVMSAVFAFQPWELQ